MKAVILRIIIAVLLSLAMTPAASLESLITAARNSSTEAYILELERRQAQTDLSLKDFVRAPSLVFDNVSSIGTAERTRTSIDITPGKDPVIIQVPWVEFSLTASPVFTYNLQGDRKTEIQAGLDEFSYSFDAADTSDVRWSVSPFVKITQPLTHFFEDDRAIDDIDYSITYLSSELSYRQGMIGIDQKVLDAAAEVLSLDRELSDVQYKLEKLIIDHERSLSLGVYTSDSARGRGVLQQKDGYERRIEFLQRSRRFVLDEVYRLTGLRIEEVPAIPVPNPVLEPSAFGNTTVLLKALAADMAEEQLKEYSKDSWGLDVYTGYGASFNEKNPTSPGHRVEAGVSGNYRDLVLSAGVTSDFGNKNTLRGVISGSWSIDGNRQEREFTRQKLEYAHLISRQQHETAENEYERRNMQLELNLESWIRNLAQLELREHYAELDYEDAVRALERGIGRQGAADDALHVLEQINYEKKLLYIEGWKLQRSIESHLL